MAPNLKICDRSRHGDHTRILFEDEASDDLYYSISAMELKDIRTNRPGHWCAQPIKINKGRIVPQYTNWMTKVHHPSTNGSSKEYDDFYARYYVKHPNYLSFGKRLLIGDPLPIDIMGREIVTCEYLRKHPHPSICAYHGVVLDVNNYAEGLVFDNYKMDLEEYVNQGNTFDARKVLKDIEAGIDHMHSIGLVHCDIKPENIFVDVDAQRFVIGDFDSTHRRGDRLGTKWGTRGWNSKRFMEAHREVDFHGLSMIRFWLQNKGFGAPLKGARYMETANILSMAKEMAQCP